MRNYMIFYHVKFDIIFISMKNLTIFLSLPCNKCPTIFSTVIFLHFNTWSKSKQNWAKQNLDKLIWNMSSITSSITKVPTQNTYYSTPLSAKVPIKNTYDSTSLSAKYYSSLRFHTYTTKPNNQYLIVKLRWSREIVKCSTDDDKPTSKEWRQTCNQRQ
jgi:hypothetical protein